MIQPGVRDGEAREEVDVRTHAGREERRQEAGRVGADEPAEPESGVDGAVPGRRLVGHLLRRRLHERSTFDDPSSGYQVSRDGQYDHWYTNGQGDYYGTGHPNVDPSALGHDWQQIQPPEPNP